MLCGLGMNALATDTNAGSMPVIGMPSTVRPASPMWHGATSQTRLPLLADQAQLGLFSIGDVALIGGGILIVGICLRRTQLRNQECPKSLPPDHAKAFSKSTRIEAILESPRQ
jgi:hypothetical protein